MSAPQKPQEAPSADPLPLSPENGSSVPRGRVSNLTRDLLRDVVAVRLNEEYRIIECTGGSQWILQRQSRGGVRNNQSFCATREGLLRCIRTIERNDSVSRWTPGAISAVLALPEFFRKAR